jgi:hypothetical protein
LAIFAKESHRVFSEDASGALLLRLGVENLHVVLEPRGRAVDSKKCGRG